MNLVCAIVELALYAALVAATIHLLRGAAWALRAGPLAPIEAPAPRADVPFVTVQIPLRNEPLVAEGALRTAARLEWPRERFEIQVLDDSNDETVAIVDAVAADLRAAGTPTTVVRRSDRRGFKAGALAGGLAHARGELVLVLDADFRPEPTLLRTLALELDDEDLAFVQARWSFRNEHESLLTRVQAAILDALFTIEQARLSEDGGPVQFNGTAGVWRRHAIEIAGGWATTDDALTEDLDLSFRAHEEGLRGVTLPSLAVSTELPADVASFVAQQARWVRGGGLTLRAIGRRLLAHADVADARTMIAHLVRHARQPLFVAAIVRLVLVAALGLQPRCAGWVGPLLVGLVVFASATYLGAAARRLGRTFASGAMLAPSLAALSIGLAPALSLAFVGGTLGRTAGGFARTEKRGDGAPSTPRPVSRARPGRGFCGMLALGSLAALVLFARAADPTGIAAAALCTIGCAWMAL